MSKIGIMGGTFNPVHNGHLAVAEKAASRFGLDKVLFITGGNPPHKNSGQILDGAMRHKMVCMAIENYKKFEPCDYEIKKDSYSYTVDTIRYLKSIYKDDELFLIIGADSLSSIAGWHKPRVLKELCSFLIYPREGYDMEKDLEELKKEYYLRGYLIETDSIDISSTKIRKLLYRRKNVAGLLPRKVLQFILRNGFYAPHNGTIEEKMMQALSPERFRHSVGVSKMAIELAKIYGADEKKAYLAGMVHDCAKNYSPDKMKAKCNDYDVELDEFEIANPVLIHSKLGEKVAMIDYGIRDREVLDAIKWHTLGHPDMSLMEKIIYVSDMIEENRSFDGVEELRKIARENIDKAVVACTKATVSYNALNAKNIHPMAYKVIDSYENAN